MSDALDFLIVDDDLSQLYLMESLLRDLGLQHKCHYASNGEQALDLLHRTHPFENAPRPSLILLDLNMPGMSGREVLERIKSDPQLRSIPTIVLSSSLAPKDVNACYQQHANAYIHKPMDIDETLQLLSGIDRFWCHVLTAA